MLNVLPEPKPTPAWLVFLKQFNSPIVILLLAAALVSLFLSDIIDTVFILLVVLINTGVGFYQEIKAKKEIAALKKLVVQNVRVLRNNKEHLIDAKYLAVGDEVLLFAGDKVPADGAVISANNLVVNEAALTGESVPVDKTIHDAVFAGTTVVSGRGKFQVTKIGVNTKFGQLALTLALMPEEKTPLEVRLTRLGNQLAIAALILIAFVVSVGFFQSRDLKTLFFSGVTLAVSAIPEGLPAILTISLAVGASRLARRRAVIKRLVATETLGSVDVILTDKTGTLTKNEMTVQQIVAKDPKALLTAAVLCNTSALAGGAVLGDTTEGALLAYAQDQGLNYEEIRARHPIIREIPFDSGRKMMTVITAGKSFTKGAPEKVIPLCTSLSEKEQDNYLKMSSRLASRGLRVLAFAENDHHFLGLAAIADPPRREVRDTILACQRAGVVTVMITGDSPQTAAAVGRQVGILSAGKETVTGDQLALYSDKILDQNLAKIAIFARVSPTDKLRIVEAYQRAGKVVAVTGDGVNDAPALKKAEIGLAMGITGTEVAKEAADLIIMDDNFATIVAAIEEGRIIFTNLLKTIKYLLSTNLSEVVTVSVTLLFGLPLPLTPSAILWLNVVSDSLPALALATDPADGRRLSPTAKKMVIGWQQIAITGLVLGLAAFLVFLSLRSFGLDIARLGTFTTLVVLQLGLAILVRGSRQNFFANKLLLLAIGLSLVAQAAIISLPDLRAKFI